VKRIGYIMWESVFKFLELNIKEVSIHLSVYPFGRKNRQNYRIT